MLTSCQLNLRAYVASQGGYCNGKPSKRYFFACKHHQKGFNAEKGKKKGEPNNWMWGNAFCQINAYSISKAGG